ncbi:glycosyltransferase, putative [Ricinus communis]|uniref:Glycosyltransferase, putative n=1 Tax=Ricinus communis TaxID=3988 RepID=B9THQ0_RICCO|nr:glycosyltransferase, putative [Ricinus communis]
MQTLAYNGGIMASLKQSPLRYGLVPFFVLAQLIAVIKVLRATRIDVIHAHWLIPQGGIALLGRYLAFRSPYIVCTSHGGDLFGLQQSFLQSIKCSIIKKVDRLTVVSQAMRDYASALADRTEIDVVSMGVDLTNTFIPESQIERCTDEILFVGRLVEKKGVCYAIMAMPQILKMRPHAKLIIVGDGPDKPSLEQLAVTMGLADHVQFIGAVDNNHLPEFYRRATVFVGPSIVTKQGDQEGLGLVFAEALGSECPVVASDLPAISDVVIDGVTGLICKQKDEADLALKVIMLLNSAALRNELAEAGRAHVLERFDWAVVAERYREIIEKTCQSP